MTEEPNIWRRSDQREMKQIRLISTVGATEGETDKSKMGVRTLTAAWKKKNICKKMQESSLG